MVTDGRHYVVRYTSLHHSPNPRYKFVNATDLNCVIDELRPNTQYEFTVKVVKVRFNKNVDNIKDV
jgi:neogenin